MWCSCQTQSPAPDCKWWIGSDSSLKSWQAVLMLMLFTATGIIMLASWQWCKYVSKLACSNQSLHGLVARLLQPSYASAHTDRFVIRKGHVSGFRHYKAASCCERLSASDTHLAICFQLCQFPDQHVSFCITQYLQFWQYHWIVVLTNMFFL